MSEPRYMQLRNFDKALNADVVKKAAKYGTTPPWIKSFRDQLEDPEYISLSLAERGFLHDLRLLAVARGNKILWDAEYLKRRLRPGKGPSMGRLMQSVERSRFVQPYDNETNLAAKALLPSRSDLDEGENTSRLDSEVDSEVTPSPYSEKNGLRSTSAQARLATRLEKFVRAVGYEIPDTGLEEELRQKGADDLLVQRLLQVAAEVRGA